MIRPNPPAIRRIAIVGSGAVGCYYGARLAAGGCEVRFHMRRDLSHVQEHGLIIRSHLGNLTLPEVQAFATTGEIGPVDLVLIALKATANEALDRLIPPLLHDTTKILTLQNGLGNEEYLASRWGPGRVLGGVCFTCINRTGPGQIEHTAQGQVSLGAYDPVSESAASAVCELFNRCGIETAPAASVPAVRWRKLVWNVPFNGLAILGGGIDTAQILASPPLAALALSIMEEVIAISHHLGYPLPDDFAAFQMEATRTMAAYRPSSMIDFVEGREVEVEAIWGEPFRRAAAAGAPAARLEMLYRLIQSAAARRL